MKTLKTLFSPGFVTVALGWIAILGIISSLWRTYLPTIDISIISFYPTIIKSGQLGVVLKLKVDSSANLIIDNLSVEAIDANGNRVEMQPSSLRWKGFLPVMGSPNGTSTYKLLGPLQPDLQVQGIHAGVNEYYIYLQSTNVVASSFSVESWTFILKATPSAFYTPVFIPSFIRPIVVRQPAGSNLYFDDSLIQKISPQERDQLINSL